jgi:tocopherol O-methyltransferase
MKTGLLREITAPPIGKKVARFYDIGSPYYLEFYGKHIHDGYYITGRESREEAQENLIKFLVEKAGIKKGSRILDVGCGIGGSSIWLAKNLGAQTTGITISPVQLEMANKMALEEVANSSFLLMNAEEMDFPETFDVLWLVAALTHFQNQENFFTLAAKFLNKDGKFIFFDWTVDEAIEEAANDRTVQSVIEGMVLSQLHSNNTYLKWLIEAGFRIAYSEDITDHTLRTWDVALKLLKEPALYKLAYKLARKEGAEVLGFLKSLRAMRKAMKEGKVKSTAIAAEKI